tara:strand:- start:2612 stop:3736 length:1125 start_codon:yes stop_codon:yes gene_type:complete
MINIFQPSLGEEELKAVGKVFESNWIGLGSKNDEFESELSNKLGCSRDNITTTTSCTEGFFQIIDYIGIGEGDEVILPSISFIGIGNAILSKGAKPVFCDVNRHSMNVESGDIVEKITSKTKAVVLLHYGGLPCEMDSVVRLCKQRGIVLIEDNACSPFSKYKGVNTGTIGDFGVWSFDPMKILVAGDCGLIYAKDKEDLKTIKERCYLGLTSGSGLSNSVDNKWWEFDISYPGRRSIINDITASIGLEQLKKVDRFIHRRKQIHDKYTRGLKKLGWITTPPKFPSYIESSYYMYWIQLESEEDRNGLAKYLKENGIYTTFRYYPLHWVKYYDDNSDLPNTETAANTTLCLPLHQSLSFDDVNQVIEAIRNYKK